MADNRDIKYTIAAEDRFGRTFANLKRDMQGGLAEAERFKGALAGVGGGISALGVGVGAAVAVAVAGLRNLANDIDALNDAADATGSSIENLSGLEDVARRNGAGLDLVTDAIIKLNKGLADVNPDSATAQALNDIGLSAKELRGLDPSEAIQRVAKALQGYASDGNKARIAQELFGKSLKEVAPFLNDLAAAGTINATVTAEQAAEAEKFNKQLSAWGTNINDAARGLANQLIPQINNTIDAIKRAQSVGFSLFGKELEAEIDGARFTLAVDRVLDLADAVKKDPGNTALVSALASARQEADALGKAAGVSAEQLKALADARKPLEQGAGAGRGFVNPEVVLPRIGAAKETPKDAKVSEGQRYLDNLQKQADKMLELTSYEQALQDIQLGRIKGLTPALQRQILEQARANDLSKQADELLNAEIDSRSRAEKLALDNIAAMERQNAELEKEVQGIGLTTAALADLERARLSAAIATKEAAIAQLEKNGVDERQLQQLQAEIALLERRKELLAERAGKEAEVADDKDRQKELDKLAKDQADAMGEFGRQASRNIQTNLSSNIRSVLDGDFEHIGRSWSNLLKDMAAQALAAKIGKELFGSFLSSGSFGDLGGGLGDLFRLGSSFFGIPGFAGGGDHRGGLRIVGERGPELELTGPSRIFSADKTAKMLGSQGGAIQITYAPVTHIDSRSDRAAIMADIEASHRENNRALLALIKDRMR